MLTTNLLERVGEKYAIALEAAHGNHSVAKCGLKRTLVSKVPDDTDGRVSRILMGLVDVAAIVHGEPDDSKEAQAARKREDEMKGWREARPWVRGLIANGVSVRMLCIWFSVPFTFTLWDTIHDESGHPPVWVPGGATYRFWTEAIDHCRRGVQPDREDLATRLAEYTDSANASRQIDAWLDSYATILVGVLRAHGMRLDKVPLRWIVEGDALAEIRVEHNQYAPEDVVPEATREAFKADFNAQIAGSAVKEAQPVKVGSAVKVGYAFHTWVPM